MLRPFLFVGCGAVARCTLPILLDHVKVPPHAITILDFEPLAAIPDAVTAPASARSNAATSAAKAA